ncbi:unnamed protein product [Withania somnifera]
MDLTNNNNTATTITTSSAVKTPEAETETPTSKPFPFSNVVVKRKNHHHQHHHHVVVIYKECLKNHAANLGGHAVDGCGEFLPIPSANPANPTSLKCAACGCHRNFHRREPEEPVVITPPPISTAALEYQPHHRHHPPPPRGDHNNPNSPSPPPISSAYYPASAPHMLLALSGGFDKNPNQAISTPVAICNGRKRFRTKFTTDQKSKMLEFAERVEWKIQKRDEDLVNNFCNEIGVEKGVLKVWMHNNKNASRKKLDQHISAGHDDNGNSTNNFNGFCIVSRNNTDSEFQLHHESSNGNKKENSSFNTNVVANNGSSSSSL